jgi:hypothetical protein
MLVFILSLLIILFTILLLSIFLFYIFRAKKIYIKYKTGDENIAEIMKNFQSILTSLQQNGCNVSMSKQDVDELSIGLQMALFGFKTDCLAIKKQIEKSIDKITKSEEVISKNALSKETLEYINNIQIQILNMVCVDNKIDGDKFTELFVNIKKAVCYKDTKK